MEFSFKSLLAEPRFDILEISDVTGLGNEHKLAVTECMNHALAVFLEKIGFQHKLAQRDEALRRDLRAWSTQNLVPVCVCDSQVIDRILDEAASCAEYFYPLADHDTRVEMGIGLGVTIGADDNVVGAASKSRFNRFQYDIWKGSSEQDGWAKMYTGFIRRYVEHFGANDPRVGSLGASGWANYIQACFTEDVFARELPPHLSYLPPGAKANQCCPTGFASYFRGLSGIAVAFMVGIFKPCRQTEVPFEYWLPSITNLTNFINLINDLLSWPKEVMAEESYNYMSIQTLSQRQAKKPRIITGTSADTDGWTFRDTICETMDTVYQAAQELDRAFVEFASSVDRSYRHFERGRYVCRSPKAREGDLLTFSYSTESPDTKNWIGVYYAPGGGPVNKAHVADAPTWAYAPDAKGQIRIKTDPLRSGRYTAFFLASDGFDWLARPIDIALSIGNGPPIMPEI